MRELKGTPKQIRRKSSAADAGHGSYQVASAAGRRASRTDQAVVNLVGSDDEPNTRPTKAASLKRKASATTPLADPAQTPLLLDEPPASRSRKAATAALSKVNTSDAAIGLKVVVIAGPHKGMSAMLIQPCRGTAAKSVKRGGKRNADDSCYDDALCIGRTCEESSAAAFLMLPEDEYVSDRYCILKSPVLFSTNNRLYISKLTVMLTFCMAQTVEGMNISDLEI